MTSREFTIQCGPGVADALLQADQMIREREAGSGRRTVSASSPTCSARQMDRTNPKMDVTRQAPGRGWVRLRVRG